MALRPSAVKRSDKVVAFATHTALEDRERPRLIDDNGEMRFLDNRWLWPRKAGASICTIINRRHRISEGSFAHRTAVAIRIRIASVVARRTCRETMNRSPRRGLESDLVARPLPPRLRVGAWVRESSCSASNPSTALDRDDFRIQRR